MKNWCARNSLVGNKLLNLGTTLTNKYKVHDETGRINSENGCSCYCYNYSIKKLSTLSEYAK